MDLNEDFADRTLLLATHTIPDVRVHDLRHTFASLLVSGGASLEMIGRLLGHTQTGTPQRRAHLIDAPLRAGSTPWARC